MLANADVTLCASLTVPAAKGNRCWVTSLATMLGPVAREEIRREMAGPAAMAATLLSLGVEAFARLTRLDATAYAEHALFTTSLYAGPPFVPDPLPGKATIVRSLNRRHHADVLRENRLWPVRVVWLVDDPVRDWLPRRDVHRDRKRLSESGLSREHYTALDARQLDQVMALYRRLYITRYSRHNPDYRPDYIQALLADGRLEILTLERDGGIVAFCAVHCRSGILSVPMVGYDDGAPDGSALYRMIMVLPLELAMARGLSVNLSAGAACFKRHRGAKPHVEYLMILDDHLPAWRRFGYRAVGAILRMLEPQLIKAATQ